MLEAFATGAVGFAAYLAAVLVLLRGAPRMAPSILVTATAPVVYVAILAASVAVASGRVLFWPLSASYWFLTVSFLMAFGAIHKSISLRILLDLLDCPGRCDRYDAILRRCVEYESYRARLEIIESDGLATREATGFRLTPKGRRIAAIAHGCQRLFKIEHSG